MRWWITGVWVCVSCCCVARVRMIWGRVPKVCESAMVMTENDGSKKARVDNVSWFDAESCPPLPCMQVCEC